MSVAKKFGCRDNAEDFAQEALLSIHNGRKAKLTQLLIDYLRKEFGATRDGKEHSDLFRERYGYDELDQKMIAPETLTNLDFYNLIQTLDPEERSYMVLLYEWGFSLKEIGNCYGISEGRVSQNLKDIHAKIRRFIARSTPVRIPETTT